jgi:hypothetical protein
MKPYRANSDNSDLGEDDTISTIVNSKGKCKRERYWALERFSQTAKVLLNSLI